MSRLFIYGSLMRGWPYNQYYLGDQAFQGKAHLEGYQKYIFGGLHGIFPHPGSATPGELYEVDAATLAKLDHLHNQGTVFTRTEVEVTAEGGALLPAEVYVWNG